MKRRHVHVAVDGPGTSVSSCSILFGAQPSVLKGAYAKWMLDDPRVNVAISSRGAAGLAPLGWETFHTSGKAATFGVDALRAAGAARQACGAPATATVTGCCG